MTPVSRNDPRVVAAVNTIQALQRLSRETPVKTHKTQYQLLADLEPQVLATVSEILYPTPLNTNKEDEDARNNPR